MKRRLYMEQEWSFEEAADYYREQGAPQNQQALVELLREVQEHNGGKIPALFLPQIAARLQVKETFLAAVIKRYPSLRAEATPNRLELCGGERCQKNGCRELRRFVEETYRVKNGASRQAA